MKPTVESLLLAYPDVDAKLAGEHLARLEDAYFGTFGVDHVGAHLRALGRLSADRPLAERLGAGAAKVSAAITWPRTIERLLLQDRA